MALTRTVTLRMFAETAKAQAELDAIMAEAVRLGELNPEIKPQIEKAAVTRQLAVLRAELKAQGDKAGEDLGKGISDGTRKGLGRGGTDRGGWLAAAVGLGAPLAGSLAAGGLAFSAFGALAAGSLAPVAKAMTGPGGLAAGWVTLDNRQRTAAAGVEALKARYDALSKSMEPRAFQVFNTLLSTADGLLGPLGRLAATSGAGIEHFLVQFENDSGLRQFIGYASTVAPQAISLLGDDVTSLVHSVLTLAQAAGGAGLLELRVLTSGLQVLDKVISGLPGPLAGAALGIGGIALALSKIGALSGVLKITGLAAMGSEAVAAAKGIKEATIATRGLAGAQAALDAITPWGWAILGVTALGGLVYLLNRTSTSTEDLIARLRQQDQATGFNTEGYRKLAAQLGAFRQNVTAATGPVHGIYGAISTVTRAQQDLTRSQQEELDAARNQDRFLGILGKRYGLTRGSAISLAQHSGVLASQVNKGGSAMRNALTQAEAYADSNLHAQRPVSQLAQDISDYSDKTLTAADRTKALSDALNQFYNPAVSADQAVIAMKNAQVAAAKAVRDSSGAVGTQTQKSRDARSAVLDYANSVKDAAQQAFNATHKTSDYNRIINAAVPILERLAGHNKKLRQEIQALIDTEKRMRTENVAIHVSGTGSWAVVQGGHRVKQPGAPAAAGMRVTGGIPGVDSVPILAQKDETVLSVAHSRQLAPLLRAIGVPGYAAGGVVGHYGSASIPGLNKWLGSENQATIRAISQSVVSAFKAGMAPPGTGGRVGWSPGAGVAQWAGDVSSALKQLGLPDAYKLLVLYQMMTESGGNPNIVNKWDSNWAAGHPSVGLLQVIAGTFQAYAGPYRNTGPFSYGVSVNPMANIYAALNYGAHNGRGFGTGPGQIGSGHGYARGGPITEPVLGVGLRSGSRYSFGERGAEYVASGDQMGQMISLLRDQNAMLRDQNAMLRQLIGAVGNVEAAVDDNAVRTAGGVAGALGVAGSRAAARARYSPA